MIIVITFRLKMNYSKQRDLILNTLRENSTHPTAENIYTLLKEANPKLSLATVYRNLNQLAQQGILRQIKGLDDSIHFDHQLHPHYHFLCQCCGKVYDVPESVAPCIDKSVEDVLNATVIHHEMSFIGVCSDCKKRHN